MICIAASLHQWRLGKRKTPFIVIGLLGAAAMAYVMERSLFPWPPLPESIAAGLFLVATVVNVVV